MTNILVTGGLGTIGSVLVPELRQRGHNVDLCDLRHNHDTSYHKCDIGSFRQIQNLFARKQYDYVYHLAAEFGRWNGEAFYDTLWRSNVVGNKNLIRLQEDHKFRMVFFSSSEVYGDWPGLMSEEVMEKHEVRQLNDYAISKWVGEMQCMNSAAEHGTETVRVRLFNCYGPGEYYSLYRSVVCRFIFSAMMGLPYTVYLGHHRTSIYITDMVRTLANIVERFNPGAVYNIGGTEYHDIKYLSDSILARLGLDDHLVTYADTEPFTTHDKKVSIEKATRDLDHKCLVTLDQGLSQTIQWMRDVYSEVD